MIDKNKLLIIIPAYNEQDNILQTIKELKTSSAKDLDYIVINDGSKDDTLKVLQDNQINHLSYNQNGGLSHAVRVGMAYALEHGYDYCIQIDADNQHDPAYIVDFIKAASNPHCIIVGNRYQNDKRGVSLKAIAQWYISLCFNLKTHQHMLDPTNGMRVYGKEFMQYYVDNENLMVEPSTIAYLVKKYHLDLMQVHNIIRNRENGQSMYNKRWKQLKYILRETNRMLSLTDNWTRK